MDIYLKNKYDVKKKEIFQQHVDRIQNINSQAQKAGQFHSSYRANNLKKSYIETYEDLVRTFIQICKEAIEIGKLSIDSDEEHIRKDINEVISNEKIWFSNNFKQNLTNNSFGNLTDFDNELDDSRDHLLKEIEIFIEEEKARAKMKKDLQIQPLTQNINYGNQVISNNSNNSPISINKESDKKSFLKDIGLDISKEVVKWIIYSIVIIILVILGLYNKPLIRLLINRDYSSPISSSPISISNSIVTTNQELKSPFSNPTTAIFKDWLIVNKQINIKSDDLTLILTGSNSADKEVSFETNNSKGYHEHFSRRKEKELIDLEIKGKKYFIEVFYIEDEKAKLGLYRISTINK